jgi:hypothetical protein
VRRIARGGRYYRIANPAWVDPLDPNFATIHGGRWTPPGEFGGLYLCATIEVAAANARHQHRNRAIKLFDLRPQARPVLVMVNVPEDDFLDIVTDAGIAAVKLPRAFPFGITHERCWPVARRAHAARLPGIASRSAAECTPARWVGEELTLYDRGLPVRKVGKIKPFSHWYPDADPDRAAVRRG